MTWQRLLRGGVHGRGSGISPLGLRCGGGAVSSVLSSGYFSQFGPIQLQLRRCRADMFKDFSVDGTSINDGFTDGGFWDEAISEPLPHDDLRFHCLLKDSPRLRGPPPILTESQASCHLSQQRILARSVLVKPRRHRPTTHHVRLLGFRAGLVQHLQLPHPASWSSSCAEWWSKRMIRGCLSS